MAVKHTVTVMFTLELSSGPQVTAAEIETEFVEQVGDLEVWVTDDSLYTVTALQRVDGP